MSFLHNFVKNVKEFYSELNSATLTGAIDVIVVEQEDGTLRSSPFHVRFGKLGVLKAREKIVDLEINGEPVEIHMKLDDSGAAFFVEDIEEEDDDLWSPDLATSPIPDASQWEWEARRKNVLKGQTLFPEGQPELEKRDSNPVADLGCTEIATDTGEEDKDDGWKGKLNKKKRRRRAQQRHSRKGSRSSIKEMASNEQDMFAMDDMENDADQEDEAGASSSQGKDWKGADESQPNKPEKLANPNKAISQVHRNLSLEFANSFSMADGLGGQSDDIQLQLMWELLQAKQAKSAAAKNTVAGVIASEGGGSSSAVSPSASLPNDSLLLTSVSKQENKLLDEISMENSLMGSRIPKSSSDGVDLDALLIAGHLAGGLQSDPSYLMSKSVAPDFHYFSETEATINRPDSPDITSDSELERSRDQKQENHGGGWKWGELPTAQTTPSHEIAPSQIEQSATRHSEQKHHSENLKPGKETFSSRPDDQSLSPSKGADAKGQSEKRSIIDWFRSRSNSSAAAEHSQRDGAAEGGNPTAATTAGGAKKKAETASAKGGIYLDDLISGNVDQATAAMYLSPGILARDNSGTNVSASAGLAVAPTRKTSGSKLPTMSEGDLEKTEHSSVVGGPDSDLDIGKIEVDAAQHFCPINIKEEPLDSVEEVDTTLEDPLAIADTLVGLDVPPGHTDLEPGGPQGVMSSIAEEDCESGHGPSLPMSPNSNTYDTLRGDRMNFHSDSEDDLPRLISRHLPDFGMSLCGGLSLEEAQGVNQEKFEAHQLSYTQFVAKLREDKQFLSDPKLVFRVNEKYTSWSVAAPILMSVIMFKEPLPTDLVTDLTKSGVSVNVTKTAEQVKEEKARKENKKTSSWFGWWNSSSTETPVKPPSVKPEMSDGLPLEPCVKIEIPEEIPPVETLPDKTERNSGGEDVRKREESCSSEDMSGSGRKRFIKTLRLDSEKLKALNLKPGSNEVEFSVTTAFQGTTRCKCHIYFWQHSDKIVISDIDGTITKSDVLGHILPVIGRDWAQSGVAQLFTKIRNNGYHIMYLSARAIGQATITKDYLQSVKQGDVCLPDGPLFLNPESLIHAFRKEVIDRNPEEFKIRCLKDIQSLFCGKNPFFAGYGNRPNDAYAYRAVGIPVSRIFTINPAGELRHELTQNFQTSYSYQSDLSDHYFPPVGKAGWHPELKVQDFGTFGYWREELMPVDMEGLDMLLSK